MTLEDIRDFHARQWVRYLEQAADAERLGLSSRSTPRTRAEYEHDAQNCRDLARWHAQARVTLDALIN